MIIVLNALSFLTLAFIITVYIIKWKTINDFPMRLVSYIVNIVTLSLHIMYYTKFICVYVSAYFG